MRKGPLSPSSSPSILISSRFIDFTLTPDRNDKRTETSSTNTENTQKDIERNASSHLEKVMTDVVSFFMSRTEKKDSNRDKNHVKDLFPLKRKRDVQSENDSFLWFVRDDGLHSRNGRENRVRQVRKSESQKVRRLQPLLRFFSSSILPSLSSFPFLRL